MGFCQEQTWPERHTEREHGTDRYPFIVRQNLDLEDYIMNLAGKYILESLEKRFKVKDFKIIK